MGDAKSGLQVQAAAANAAMNASASAKGASGSAPPTPLQAPAPTPQLSPTTGRSGRRLHTKMLDELKNVTSRKSPAINPNATPTGPAPLPSPLNLNGPSTSEGTFDSTMSDGADGSSPRLPAQLNGTAKSKSCGICERSFTVFRPKHTCKVCGKKICDDCSKNRVKLNRRLERRKGSRLCDSCARDYMQHSTPLQSDVRIPEETGVPEGSNGDENPVPSTFASKVVTPAAIADSAVDGFHRAPSKIKSSVRSYHTTSGESSYLRQRHWFSLIGVACLLFARLIRFQAVSAHGGYIIRDGEQQELMVPAEGIVLVLLSITGWIDRLASLRVITSYLLGLVAYDELVGRSERRTRRYLSTSAPSGVISTTQVKPRPRSRSSMSEANRLASGAPLSSASNIPPVLRERDEDEVLEVEVGDKPVDDGLGFNFDKLLASLAECTTKSRTSDDNMRISNFLSSCDQICSFVLAFGRATAFAASTVTGYISTIGTNLAGWPIPPSATNAVAFSWREQSVRAVVEREVELQVATTGGKKKPSCCRCVLRLLWFIEFVEACVRYILIENKDESCAAGASKAYEETIGARHPWIIRKGVNSALASLPTRSAIIESLNLHELPHEETIAQLKKAQVAMKAIIDEVAGLLKEHNLTDIK